jgi:Zn-dependent hydrolases, including glyoxylases
LYYEHDTKPVFIINTHGHYENIGGNRFYEEAWVPALDEELFHYNNDPEGIKSYYANLTPLMTLINKYNLQAILEQERPDTANYFTAGQTFELDGRTLSIIALGGHTPGSSGIIDSKMGYLFCGDALVPVEAGLLMNLNESITIAEYEAYL